MHESQILILDENDQKAGWVCAGLQFHVLFSCSTCARHNHLVITHVSATSFTVKQLQSSAEMTSLITKKEFTAWRDDLSRMSAFDFFTYCEPCSTTNLVRLGLQSTTVMRLSVQRSDEPWISSGQSTTWHYPVEVQWILDQWDTRNTNLTWSLGFRMTMDARNDICPFFYENAVGGTPVPQRSWRLRAYAWAFRRFDNDCGTYRPSTKRAWLHWLDRVLAGEDDHGKHLWLDWIEAPYKSKEGLPIGTPGFSSATKNPYNQVPILSTTSSRKRSLSVLTVDTEPEPQVAMSFKGKGHGHPKRYFDLNSLSSTDPRFQRSPTRANKRTRHFQHLQPTYCPSSEFLQVWDTPPSTLDLKLLPDLPSEDVNLCVAGTSDWGRVSDIKPDPPNNLICSPSGNFKASSDPVVKEWNVSGGDLEHDTIPFPAHRGATSTTSTSAEQYSENEFSQDDYSENEFSDVVNDDDSEDELSDDGLDIANTDDEDFINDGSDSETSTSESVTASHARFPEESADSDEDDLWVVHSPCDNVDYATIYS